MLNWRDHRRGRELRLFNSLTIASYRGRPGNWSVYYPREGKMIRADWNCETVDELESSIMACVVFAFKTVSLRNGVSK